MKKLFGVTYLDKEILKQNQIYHPVRLEYYEIQEQEKFGVEIVKTEYKKEKIETEHAIIKELTKESHIIQNILTQCKKGTITPCVAEEMIEELTKSLTS